MYLTDNLKFSGEIIVPSSPSYNIDRQLWNRSIQKFPCVIFYCESEDDVKSAVLFCKKNRFPIRIRSGGHNYEGFCIGNRVAVIDVSRLDKIVIDECVGTLKIQSGVTNSKLYEYVGERGYPFPGGTCPTVGVTGYALGGGWGLSARLFGLGCDNLLEAKIVDYRGKILIANENCNKNLFWALRGGGGGNFGVVTSLTFKLPPKLFNVTSFTIDYSNQTAENQADLMDIWQKNIKTLDRRLNLIFRIYNSKEDGVGASLRGLFYGKENDLLRIIKPFLDYPDAKYSGEETTFLNAIRKIEAGYAPSEKFKSTGRFVSTDYSYDTLLFLTKGLQNTARGSVYAAITLYGLGGATKDKESYETAFYFRNANYIIGIQSVWEENRYADENKLWVMSRFEPIKLITEGSYVNFPYSPLKQYEKEYYGDNMCRLRKISMIYDPIDLFTYPQGIN